jgi:hypothetical protein
VPPPPAKRAEDVGRALDAGHVSAETVQSVLDAATPELSAAVVQSVLDAAAPGASAETVGRALDAATPEVSLAPARAALL